MRRLQFFIHSLAHLVNDSYGGGFLAPLLPLLAAKHGLSLASAGLLVTALTLTASLAQPIWGWWSDRHPNRWIIPLGTFTVGFFMSLIGITPDLFTLVLVITLGGLGTGLFHPPATAVASALSNNRKGMAIAFFITAGTAGSAFGPIFVSFLVEWVGLNWMFLAAIPSTLVVILWLFFGPRDIVGIDRATHHSLGTSTKAPLPIKPLTLLTITSVIRAFVLLTYSSFLPFHLKNQGFDLKETGFFIFALQFGDALGSLSGGILSDKIGRWKVMIWTPLATIPVLCLFLNTSGWLSVMLLMLGGLLLFASTPAVVLSAQKLMNQREGLASAMQIGFAWGTAGLLMGPMGSLAELIGIKQLLFIMALLPVFMSITTLLLHRRREDLEGF
ncbi:MAG: MFS transporter [bacterium]|nr:MFS transporter [bacterium]